MKYYEHMNLIIAEIIILLQSLWLKQILYLVFSVKMKIMWKRTNYMSICIEVIC